MDLEVKGFFETSFLDWDGKIVSTVCVPLCNLRCPFCHNSGLIEHPHTYENIPLKHIDNFLVEHKDFIDGVCLTGGEPCLHKNRGLIEYLKRIKKMDLLVKFDTNGTDPKTLKQLIDQKLIDYIAMDLKGPLDERYNKLTGVKTDLVKIKQSIELIRNSGLGYEFRTTVVPTLLDIKDIEDMAKAIAGAEKFALQQFVPENSWSEALRSIKPYEKEQLDEMVKVCQKYIANTIVRGA